jgi:endonuclease YncB( thermonuclease family)
MTVVDFDRASLWHFRAYVVRVIDGDTFVAMCDTGFSGRHEAHIRLDGVNAPELTDEGGITARLWLQANLPVGVGWPLRIVTTQRERVVSEVTSFERFVAMALIVQPDGSLKNLKELL